MTRAFSAGRKSGGDELGQLRGEELAGEDENGEQEAHEGHDRGENVPTLVFPSFGGIFGENGNKGDAEGGAGDQIIQEVGKREGGIVSVGEGVRADLVGDHPFADEAEETAEQDPSHDHGGGSDHTTVYAGLIYDAGFTHDGLTRETMVEVLGGFA